MSATRRIRARACARALPVLGALLTLSSCGIPATGVVEAGGPAEGIAPVAAVYFVRDGALVPVLRPTEHPDDPDTSLTLLLSGPPPGQRLTTELQTLPTAGPLPTDPSADPRRVSADRNTLTVRLPETLGELTDRATAQLICTIAAAHRVSAGHTALVTVELLEGEVKVAAKSDGQCPQP